MLVQKDITNYSVRLPDSLKETSGLLYWHSCFWTMNDHRKPFLYTINPKTGFVERKIKLIGVKTEDWEDLAQDEQHIYVGDFGDNDKRARIIGRTIYKVSKKEMMEADSVVAQKINFQLEGYFDDRNKKPNQTNFDCEAMIALNDSLYLFTKEWKSLHTTVFVLPNKPGDWVARKKQSVDVDGLVTGATYFSPTNTLALCGYNTDMKTYIIPFVYLFSEFGGNDFFSGKRKKVFLGRPFHQVEGVATNDGKNFFFTNEGITKDRIIIAPLLMKANLEKYRPVN